MFLLAENEGLVTISNRGERLTHEQLMVKLNNKNNAFL
jgi:hypothetical protein